MKNAPKHVLQKAVLTISLLLTATSLRADGTDLPNWTPDANGLLVIPAFSDETNLRPVTKVPPYAFWNNTAVRQVILGDNVTEIAPRAFWFCTELISIEIPAATTTIGERAFDDCVQLQSFTLSPQNRTFTCADGALLSRDGRTIIRCPEGKVGSYTVPDGVEIIGPGAFRGCYRLETITLPAGIKRIENRAFLSCCELKQITLPEGLESIGDYAFTDCSKITRLVIPAGVKKIGENAFSWTNSLKEIEFEGDAPEAAEIIIGHFVPNYPTVRYRKDATGWSAGGWRGLKSIPLD